jgi:predicted N-acetyltransferase YhbS
VHTLVPFAEEHVDRVAALCAAEGWPSWTPERTRRALQGAGVIAVVALDGRDVVGVAELLTDGAVMAYLAPLVVAEGMRGRGVGDALVREAARRSGLDRVDLLAEDSALGFYERFPHKRKPGVRIYL